MNNKRKSLNDFIIENNMLRGVRVIDQALYARIQSLVSGLEVDLDAPLSDEDE